jgi:uncharacterized protein YidB (DUF937 family)
VEPSSGGGAGATPPDGGLVGGFGGLLEKLQSAGYRETVKSWLGLGQNQPIDSGQLHSALGQKTVSDVAQQADTTAQELLSQLSQSLPQFVDKLTPNGRIPSLQEIAAALSQKKGILSSFTGQVTLGADSGADANSLYYLACTGEQRGRRGETERLCGLHQRTARERDPLRRSITSSARENIGPPKMMREQPSSKHSRPTWPAECGGIG